VSVLPILAGFARDLFPQARIGDVLRKTAAFASDLRDDGRDVLTDARPRSHALRLCENDARRLEIAEDRGW
jgi:hypothetical protein